MQTYKINAELWATGLYLAQASRHFAPEELLEKWEEINKRSGLREAQATFEEQQNAQIDFVEIMGAILKPITDISRTKESLMKSMQDCVLRLLWQGELIAFGYEKPRKMNSDVHQLPAQALQGHINWDRSSLTYQGLEFVEIRLLTAEKVHKAKSLNTFLETYLEASPNTNDVLAEPEKPTLGRPTVRHAIVAAFEALRKAGEIDPTASQKHHFPKIRTWIERNEIDVNIPPEGISDKTIGKFFSPLFKQLKRKDDL